MLAAIISVSVIAVLLIVILACSIRVVKQTNKYIIERFGAYIKTWSVGIHFLIPFIDRVAKKVSMKEQLQDFPPQPVITKDNVTMQIDTIVFFQVTDPQLYTYGVEDPIIGISALCSTTLRNIIGELDLDQTLTSRDIINAKMRNILDEATDAWGIKVNRVEVKNILPPKDIRDAMERQMRAERERREKILLAEGNKQSAILNAEGEKRAAILRAEADKESRIRRAEGEAESILKIKNAEAQGIDLLNKANPIQSVLALKSLETLSDIGNGQATKLIVPSDMSALSSLTAGLTEVVKTITESKEAQKNS